MTSSVLAFRPDLIKQDRLDEELRRLLHEQKVNSLDQITDSLCLFDLSKVSYYDIGALLWLISLLHRLKKQRNDIQLLFPPENSRVWDFLIRWRFFKALALCVDDSVNLLKPEQLKCLSKQPKYTYARGQDESGESVILHSTHLLEITTLRPPSQTDNTQPEEELAVFLEKFNDRVIVSALSNHCGWDHSLTKRFVREVVGEGLQNTFLHSQGSFTNISLNIDSRNLILAIADNGVGIPNVLRDAYATRRELNTRSDSELINFFTERQIIEDSAIIDFSTHENVSSSARRGLGLFYLKTLVLDQRGHLEIRSGRARVRFSGGEQIETVDDLIESPGTMLRIVTPIRNT